MMHCSPKETFDAFNFNVFGILNVTRAGLPYMRAQKSGLITHFGFIGSWGGSPSGGIDCSTKWAISVATEVLHAELAPSRINVVIVEPEYLRTGFLNPGARV